MMSNITGSDALWSLTVELVIHLLKQEVCQVEQDHLHSPKGTAFILDYTPYDSRPTKQIM